MSSYQIVSKEGVLDISGPTGIKYGVVKKEGNSSRDVLSQVLK